MRRGRKWLKMGKIIDKEDEIIEMVLNDKEIDELIKKLNELKESKLHIHFDLNKKDSILINHEKDKF